MRFSFNNRSLGNGCRMMHFLVLASFRGRTKKDEGGRNEKSGMVFYGESKFVFLDVSEEFLPFWNSVCEGKYGFVQKCQ